MKKKMRPTTLLLAAFAFVGGCDAWPMQFENRSGEQVVFRYLHADHAEWSAALLFPKGTASLLARGHYFRGVRGLWIKDGPGWYRATTTTMTAFHRVCDRASFCTITYFGHGRLQVSRG